MNGFFGGVKTISHNKRTLLIPKCGACGLHKTCNSPKMPVTGKGKRKVLIVAEAPGKQEDEQNEQLVGESGQLLRRQLSRLGWDLNRDCWKTNSIICRPPDNRTPTQNEIEYCRPNLAKAIKNLKPRVIILLGGSPVQSFLGPLWKSDVGGISRWRGFQIPSQKYNAWICPTWHPSYLLRSHNEVLDLEFKNDLRRAIEQDGRPYKKIPNRKDQIEVILNHRQAAKIIRNMEGRFPRTAFDYETNMLKPEGKDAQIVSCSICWGGSSPRRTIAFPWYGEAVSATREMIRGPSSKIASNIKFEDRWTRTILKTEVRNWEWDTMLQAHFIDNRPGITSIKFQAFVMLGEPTYNDNIEPFLNSRTSMSKNRVKEIPIRELLIYNGLDSLLEFEVAIRQMEEMDART